MTPLEQVAQAIAEHGRPNWVAHVPITIRTQVEPGHLLPLLAAAKWSTATLTKTGQYATIMEWCSGNVFAETTVTHLAELSGLSTVSVRNFIKDSPHLFRKLRRGVWEVRDPKADREAQR